MALCARPGCTGVTALARSRFCSCRCAALFRVGLGRPWLMPTREQRQAGARKAGILSGETRRLKAARRLASQLDKYITAEMRLALSPAGVSRLRVLLARAWQDGHKIGVCTIRQREMRHRKRAA